MRGCGAPHLGENMKWKTEEKRGKNGCTESPIKPVLLGLYGSDLFYCCFNVKVLLFCFLVLMLLLLGLFIFLKCYFWKYRREIFKGERRAHVTCSREALVHGLEFLLRLPSAPVHPHLRCQQVRQVLTALTTKVLWKLIQRSPNFPKQTLPLFWLCYETRWNQVVLTEVLFEVWCDFQRSKNKTWGVRSNRNYEKLCSTLGEIKSERATKPQGAESHQPPPAPHVLHKHQTVSLAKPPSPKWGGYLGNTSPRERAVRKTMPKKIQLLVYSVSCNHKMACEEETFPNLWFFSNISEQLK